MPLASILPHLPAPLCEEIRKVLSSPPFRGSRPSEVRLRQGRNASLSVFCGGRLRNVPLSFFGDADSLKETFSRAVGGSLYAFEEQLKEGYLSLSGGVRVGVSGRAMSRDGRICSLLSIDTLVFRLPSGNASADALFSFYKKSAGGILLFAPPGGGKTTLLRAFAECAAKEERVAVVDTREEFFFSDKALLLDHLAGYPKERGAEIAVRTLSPELLVLDEIGVSEAAGLCALVSFGVRTVASVHGEDAASLLSTPSLLPLLRAGLFSHLWDVRRGYAVPIPRESSV